MKRSFYLALITLCLLVCLPSEARSQITIPYVFVNGQTADADAVNSDMNALASAALNRTGGTISGNILVNAGVTIDGIDIGAVLGGTGTPTFAGLTLTGPLSGTSATLSTTLGVTGASTLAALSATTGAFSGALTGTSGAFSTTLTVTGLAALNSTAANALDVAGGITAGSGNVAIVDTTGKIPAISTTYFASLSGANLTGLPAAAITGTIPGGVTWNGNAIGLTYGGTGVSLAATGGTSQFLRQNTVGGTVTVVRPSTSDLSDGTNVAVLNAVNTFAPGAVAQIEVFNSTAANGGYLTIQRSGVGKLYLGQPLSILGVGTADDAVAYTDNVLWLSGDGGINFADVGVKRWGINLAGDFTFGASSHIADSSGTPTISSGFGGAGSIGGNDYAFYVLGGPVASTTGVVLFGHAFGQLPICTATSSDSAHPVSITTSLSTVTFFYTSVSSMLIYVLCRGY